MINLISNNKDEFIKIGASIFVLYPGFRRLTEEV
jgi:hypothetical protein